MFYMKLARKISDSVNFVRAIRYISEQNYDGAALTLKKIYRNYDMVGPSDVIPVDVNLAAVLLAVRTHDKEECLSAASIALFQLSNLDQRGESNGNYNQDDIIYMIYYCKYCLESNDAGYDEASNSISRQYPIKFSELNFKNVKSRLKRAFYLTEPLVSEVS